MTGQDPAVEIAKLDGRLSGIEGQLLDIRDRMATREGAAGLASTIARVERVLAEEVAARTIAVNEVKNRLQLVEDRIEARKFQFGIAIALGALGIVFQLVQSAIGGAVGL